MKDDFLLFINYLPTIGRVLVTLFGGILSLIGVIETFNSKKIKPLTLSLIGIIFILLEVFIPIAVINAITAGAFLVVFGLLCIVALTS